MNPNEFTQQPVDRESTRWPLRPAAILQAFRRIPLSSSGDGSQRERSRTVRCHDACPLPTSCPAEFSRKFVAPNRLTPLHDRSGADRPEFVPRADLTNFSRNWHAASAISDLE